MHALSTGLDRALLQAADVDATFGELLIQHRLDLLDLEIGLGVQRQQRVAQLDFRTAAFEIVAIGNLSVGLVDRVGHLVHVDFGNYVETWH